MCKKMLKSYLIKNIQHLFYKCYYKIIFQIFYKLIFFNFIDFFDYKYILNEKLKSKKEKKD